MMVLSLTAEISLQHEAKEATVVQVDENLRAEIAPAIPMVYNNDSHVIEMTL